MEQDVSVEIISLVLNYLFSEKTNNINYLLISKKWYNAYKLIKCRICKRGIYIQFTQKFKCYNCYNILISKEKKNENIIKINKIKGKKLIINFN